MSAIGFCAALACLQVACQTALGATTLTRSRQLLQPLPGVIPVYIRPGDTPLEEINQDLAEAFLFNSVKHGRLAFGRELNVIQTDKKDTANIDDITLDDARPAKEQQPDSQHIQKIPRH